jgi:uncharacterized membrane protein YeaQ/YmgE (transglycosylase-associated protein family)
MRDLEVLPMLWTILIGFVVGLLARAIKPGKDALGWIMTALVGVGGAILAKLVGVQLGWYTADERAGFLASVGGAVVLLFVYEVGRRALARGPEHKQPPQ